MDTKGIPALALKVCMVVTLAAAANACVLVAPESGGKSSQDVLICHKGKKTMTLPREAVSAHMGHGDRHGPC